MGVARDGTHKADYQPGLELHAKYTFFAEGVRGHLTKELKRIFDLEARLPAAGLWARHQGAVGHRSGQACAGQGDPHPGLAARPTPGAAASSTTRRTARWRSGSWSRSTTRTRICRRSRRFQRWKQHPAIREMLEGGKRVAYGARAINEGGWQSVPQLAFPGGALIGCSAGLRQRAADQGQPHRDEVRHARGRGGLRGDRRRARSMTRSTDTRRRCDRAGSRRSCTRSATPSRRSPSSAAWSAPSSPAPTCGCASSRSACPSR